MTARIDERRLGERAVSTTALLPLLTDNFLETLRLAAIACGRHDVGQAEVISFALWCYEMAGREPPVFGRFSEAD